MFKSYEFCGEDETQVWSLPRAERGPIDPPTATDFALTDTPTDSRTWSRLNEPLRHALTLLRDQLPKENLWLEDQLLGLAEEVERLRALRAQHRLS